MLVTSWQFTAHTAACTTELCTGTTVWNTRKYLNVFSTAQQIFASLGNQWAERNRIHSWEWAFYENSVANVEVKVFWDETTSSSEQGSSVLRKMELSRDWKTLAPTCQTAWHHNLEVHKPKWFHTFRTDTGTHTGFWRMKPRNINGV